MENNGIYSIGDVNSKIIKKCSYLHFFVLNKIIYICISITFIIISFFVGKFDSKKDISQLQNDLKITNDKLSDVGQRNEKLIQLNEEQKVIINELSLENQNSTKHIESIKEISSSTKEKLNNLESSADSAMSSINKLKENNKILKEYFNSILCVMEE